VVLFIVTLFGSAMTIYLAERRPQPDKLGRILDGLWWTVATLTGGNTDVSPTTQAGHLVATFDMLLGLGIFGLLTGILATGFVDEHRRRDFVQNWNLVTGVPFFRTLDPRGVIDIARLLRRWDVPERTTVVRRGRAGDCMYFIASGMVEVLVEPHPVKLAAGAFFGEMALLGDGRRGATVVTVAPSTLLILEHSDFRSFMAHHPDLARAIDEAAAVRRPTAETARAIAADDECASTPSLDLIHE
jgi:voltage-gated potassium channel